MENSRARVRRSWGLVAGVLVAVALLVGLGATALASDISAAGSARTVHTSDRLALQNTLAGLGYQYLAVSEGELMAEAGSGPWNLTPGDPSDTARLARFLRTSPLTSAAAVLTTLTGTPITAARTSGVVIPAASDPGYASMRAGLLAGRLPVSELLRSSGQRLIALAAPVKDATGRPIALLIGYSDASHWALQAYVAQIHVAPGAQGYVTDSSGAIVAGPTTGSVGGHIPGFVASPQATHPATIRAGRLTITVAPVGIGGWQSVTTQPTVLYDGVASSGANRAHLLLLAALVLGIAGVIAAGAVRQQSLRRAAAEALADPLTGLPTRRLLDARLPVALARATRTGAPLVVLFADLDGFKAVNDRHGHRRGDALLREIGRRLSQSVRADDLVVRLGGDEFVILVEGVADAQQVPELAARITQAVGRPVELDRAVVTVGISLGAVLAHRGSPAVLLEAADAAMYDAKRAGDGPVVRHLGVLDQLGPTPLGGATAR